MLNPIASRELTSVLRRPQALWLQCGLAVGFALLVLLRWPTDARIALSGVRSQEVFRLFSYGLLTMLLLVVPGFPATSIVREKNAGTLALLFNTPMPGWRILAGKLQATLGLAGLLLCLSLPAGAACFALGGISLREFGSVYGLLALTALTVTSVGLLVSSHATSTDGAVRWTYGIVLFLSVGTLILDHFFAGTGMWLEKVVSVEWIPPIVRNAIVTAGEALGATVAWMRHASPIATLMSVLGAGDVGRRGVAGGSNTLLMFVLMSGGITLISLGWTLSRLNHRIFDRSRSAGAVTNEQSANVQVFRGIMYFFFLDPRRRSMSIRFLNPVMVKELRCRKYGRLHWQLRLVAVCAVGSIAFTVLTATQTIEWDVPTIGAIMVLLQVALLVLITPSLTAGLISTERESGGWTLLQMTPLSIFRIVWGKLLSVILTLVLLLCATLPGYLVMVYIEPGIRLEVERVVICLAVTAVFVMLLSAAVGCLFKKTATATAVSYVTLLVVCAAPLLVWLGRGAPFGHRTVELALSVNPVAAAFSVIRLQGFANYDLIPANWWFMGIASVASLIVMLMKTYQISRPA